MPSVTLNALLVDDQSLLRVCPPGRTLGNNIIGVTDIACGHNSNRPFAQGEKWILGLIDTASLNTTKKAWGGLIKTDHNVFAQGGIRAPLEAERTQSPRRRPNQVVSRAVVTNFLLLEGIAWNSHWTIFFLAVLIGPTAVGKSKTISNLLRT